ncbi:MAG: PRC-barrel domain-containing protein [Methylobacteriaceae bacterium]|nr:PRC-barrel domain-containing protein [Methylobacteriaceae bacterium]
MLRHVLFASTMIAAAAGAAFAQAPAPAPAAPPASAAQPAPPAPPIHPSQMQAPKAAATTAPTVEAATDMRVSTLIGLNIKNAANETIGEIEDIIIDESNTLKGYIVSVGGFLGLGERHVAVAPADVKMSRIGSTTGTAVATMNTTKDQLKARPEFKYMSTWRRDDAAAGGVTTAPRVDSEASARAAITAAGYSGVTALARDAGGVWRGQASKDGRTVTVMIDPQGRVVAQ